MNSLTKYFAYPLVHLFIRFPFPPVLLFERRDSTIRCPASFFQFVSASEGMGSDFFREREIRQRHLLSGASWAGIVRKRWCKTYQTSDPAEVERFRSFT